jgi:hypothetical protein
MQNVSISTTPDGQFRIRQEQGAMRPLSNREIEAIRDRRSEMSDQLVSAQGRRKLVLDALRDAPPGTEAGLQQQFQVLSERIAQIERDIESSGQMLRTGLVPQQTVSLVPPDATGLQRLSDETIAILGVSFSFFFLLPLAIGAMRLMFRRSRRTAANAEPSPEQAARMERLEQAVDAVAIEIERVGEAQRFQARVLAEANMMPVMPVGHAPEPARMRDFEDAPGRYPHS